MTELGCWGLGTLTTLSILGLLNPAQRDMPFTPLAAATEMTESGVSSGREDALLV